MNISFYTYLTEDEKFGGSQLRNKAVLKIFKALGHEVKITYRTKNQSHPSILTYLKGLLYGLNTRTLFNTAHSTLAESDYIHFDNLQFFNWTFNRPLPPIIFNTHDLQFENFGGRDNSSKPHRLIKYELQKMRQSHLVFVCSTREKNLICQHALDLEDKIFVLPNLVDGDNFCPPTDIQKDTISFIGTLGYFPNQEAIKFLCNSFMPSLTNETKSKYRFVIAGRGPLDGQKELAEKAGFEFMTDLTSEELSNLLHRTKVSLVPLSHGSGTRLKILEAVFSKALVLSTPLGTEGIESNLVTVASLSEFASRLENLLQSEPIQEKKALERFYQEFDTMSWFANNKSKLIEKLKT
ncbi:MAG: glycosyltransferase family 4 protein [Halobacteriovoraceae bacterium]|nr:glycosyltransferase family 4 protein [Halobacteriovoraceae bacterium]